jgi:hypothetical protein
LSPLYNNINKEQYKLSLYAKSGGTLEEKKELERYKN